MSSKINTVSEALDILNTAVGGTAGEIPADATKVDALKQVYKTLGGAPADVEELSTVSEMVEKLANVAGGGGGGDFVKLTLSCKVSTPDSEDSFNMDFSDRTTEESASYIDAFRIDPEYGIQANPESPYVLYDEPYTGEIYIIKDGCIFVYAGEKLENTYTVTGAGEIVADYNGEYAVKVTGDCEITVAGFPSE